MDPNANAALAEWRAQVAARAGGKPAAAPAAKPVAAAPRLGFFAALLALFTRRS